MRISARTSASFSAGGRGISSFQSGTGRTTQAQIARKRCAVSGQCVRRLRCQARPMRTNINGREDRRFGQPAIVRYVARPAPMSSQHLGSPNRPAAQAQSAVAAPLPPDIFPNHALNPPRTKRTRDVKRADQIAGSGTLTSWAGTTPDHQSHKSGIAISSSLPVEQLLARIFIFGTLYIDMAPAEVPVFSVISRLP